MYMYRIQNPEIQMWKWIISTTSLIKTYKPTLFNFLFHKWENWGTQTEGKLQIKDLYG